MPDKTNLEISIESMLADLARIAKGNGFFSDIKTKPFLANYAPDDPAVMALDAPAILVWVLESNRSEYSAIGAPRFDATVWIAGTVKQDRETQKKLWRLGEDIHNVMYWNPQRGFPSSSVTPTWCYSSQPEVTQFFLDPAQGSYGSGQLLSKWRVIFNAPNPQL